MPHQLEPIGQLLIDLIRIRDNAKTVGQSHLATQINTALVRFDPDLQDEDLIRELSRHDQTS